MVILQKEESEYLSPKGYLTGQEIHFRVLRYEGAIKGKYGLQHEIRILNRDEENPLRINKKITLYRELLNSFIDFFGKNTDEWDGKEGILQIVENPNQKDGKKFVLKISAKSSDEVEEI